MATSTLALLALFGLVAGIGITAIGPGGVLATIGLLLLTDLGPAAVAGTAIATHVATGGLGTYVYHRSGQLRQRSTRRIALVLGAAAILGTPLGVLGNGFVSSRLFALLLAGAVVIAGVLVWLRQHAVTSASPRREPPPAALTATIGIGVAAAAGLFGIGGPMLSVPLLVFAGTPMLAALGAAQAQALVIATIGTLAYLTRGSIDWPLAVIVGVPELAGVVLGHRLARAIPAHWLTYSLAGVLIVLAPWLALHG